MEKECEIVQDLLLNYVEDNLNPASKELVEKHLKNCKRCQEQFNILKEDNENEDEQIEEIDYLKNIKKKMSKKNIILIVLGIILLISVILNILVFSEYNSVVSDLTIRLKDDITMEERKI